MSGELKKALDILLGEESPGLYPRPIYKKFYAIAHYEGRGGSTVTRDWVYAPTLYAAAMMVQSLDAPRGFGDLKNWDAYIKNMSQDIESDAQFAEEYGYTPSDMASVQKAVEQYWNVNITSDSIFYSTDEYDFAVGSSKDAAVDAYFDGLRRQMD